MVSPEPFRTKHPRGVEDCLIDRENAGQCITLVEVNNAVCKGLDMPADRTEDENRVPVSHKTPSCRHTQFAEVLRKGRDALACRGHLGRHEFGHKWALIRY